MQLGYTFPSSLFWALLGESDPAIQCQASASLVPVNPGAPLRLKPHLHRMASRSAQPHLLSMIPSCLQTSCGRYLHIASMAASTKYRLGWPLWIAASVCPLRGKLCLNGAGPFLITANSSAPADQDQVFQGGKGFILVSVI